METRIIKTCQGLEKMMFIDGALVSADDLESIEWKIVIAQNVEMRHFRQQAQEFFARLWNNLPLPRFTSRRPTV